jgi:hypothetical protein
VAARHSINLPYVYRYWLQRLELFVQLQRFTVLPAADTAVHRCKVVHMRAAALALSLSEQRQPPLRLTSVLARCAGAGVRAAV